MAVPRAVLGPDPLRLSGAFAAAKAAAQLAGVKAKLGILVIKHLITRELKTF